MSVREPAVAGTFYRAGADELRRQVESCFTAPGGPGSLPTVSPAGPRKIIGLVSPHAGLMYSGSVAAHAYHCLAEDGLPETAVLIGPNHRSYSPPIALSDERAWRTPVGEVALDTDTTREIASGCREAVIEPAAHRAEHSLEVQLPFLQYVADSAGAAIRIVPILIGASAHDIMAGGEAELARQLGSAVADALQGKNAVVIASTDFTHFETGEAAQNKDSRAISSILALDEKELLDTVAALDISMCGALPTAVMIAASKKLGATTARQLVYSNSGDVTGDYTEVVGYGALAIYK